MKRRNFLGIASSTLAVSFLDAHSLLAFSGCASGNKTSAGQPLIKKLRLQTACPLTEMKKFYWETIGFAIVHETLLELTIQAGTTLITFEYIKLDGDRPFYHFAFNIPENKIQKAFEWQRKKTAIIHPNPKGPTDKITHFAHWDAHSIFFLDPAGNLLEYIARHTLNNAAQGDFSVNDILYASEIGFIVDNVSASGTELMQGLNISEYKPLSDEFWPVGDENGLLLLIKKGKEWHANENQKNITDVFETKVTISPDTQDKFIFTGYPYEISIG